MRSRRTKFIFNLLFLMCFIIFNTESKSFAADSTYIVKNIAVDVEGKDAIDARDKALTKARRDAFNILSGRFLDANERATLGYVDDAMINSMVNDFEINREKFSRNRYLASIEVRFNERAVRSYLGRYTYKTLPDSTYGQQHNAYGSYPDYSKNEDIGDVYSWQEQAPLSQTPAISPDNGAVGLILPWYRLRGNAMLWHDNNPWMAAWKQWTKTDQAREMRLLTPIGDITDMQIFNPEKPLNYDQFALVRLLARYGADYAVIALADPLPNGMMNIGLYQSTTSVPRFIDKIVSPSLSRGTNNGDVAVYFPVIAQSAKRIVATPRTITASYGAESDDKTASVRSVDIASFSRDNTVLIPFEAEVTLNNIRQWVGIKASLSQLPGMQDMQIRSLSVGRAIIGFRYAGDMEVLNAALRDRGMTIYKNPVSMPGTIPYVIVPSQS